MPTSSVPLPVCKSRFVLGGMIPEFRYVHAEERAIRDRSGLQLGCSAYLLVKTLG